MSKRGVMLATPTIHVMASFRDVNAALVQGVGGAPFPGEDCGWMMEPRSWHVRAYTEDLKEDGDEGAAHHTVGVAYTNSHGVPIGKYQIGRFGEAEAGEKRASVFALLTQYTVPADE